MRVLEVLSSKQMEAVSSTECIEAAVSPTGLTLVPNFLTDAEHDALLSRVQRLSWNRVGYNPLDIGYCTFKKEWYKLYALPRWLDFFAKRLKGLGFFEQKPNQVLAIHYRAGAGVESHVDSYLYGDSIAGISLQSPCVMELRHRYSKDVARLLLLPKSLYVLQSDARHDWEHSIPVEDVSHFGGVSYEKGERYSLTFRNRLISSGS